MFYKHNKSLKFHTQKLPMYVLVSDYKVLKFLKLPCWNNWQHEYDPAVEIAPSANHLTTEAWILSRTVLLCSIVPHWQPKMDKVRIEIRSYFLMSSFWNLYLLKKIHTLVIISLNCPSFHASVGWFIIVIMALSYSSYLSYKNTNSAQRWACSAALSTYVREILLLYIWVCNPS